MSSDPDAVVFLDFDQELLAARISAGEHALGLLARAGRAVGGRRRGGGWSSRPGCRITGDRAPRSTPIPPAPPTPTRRCGSALRLPPFSAMAFVSGEAAAEFVDGFRSSLTGVDIQGPADGVWRLRAADHQTLCDALAAAPRPSGRLRIEVDPRRA